MNWPRLNTPLSATDGYLDTLNSAHADRVIGQLVPAGKHQRGFSNARVGYMEEGKKRIE